MKHKYHMLLTILACLFSSWSLISTESYSCLNNLNEEFNKTKNSFIPKDSLPSFISENEKTKIISANFYQLDTFTTSWNLSHEQLLLSFNSSKQVSPITALKIIENNYHPFAIEGKVILQDTLYYYTLTPAGIIILNYSCSDAYKYHKINNNDLELLPKNYQSNWHVKILSKKKYYEEPIPHQNNDSSNSLVQLYNKYLQWNITVTQMNEYFALCEWKPRYALNTFLNVKCGFYGDTIFKNTFYSYDLECSGMTTFHEHNKQNATSDDYGFGCFNKKQGEKYVIEIQLTSD